MVDVDLRSLLTSLEVVGQCPVCLEFVKPPVILCVNGHGMCSSCKASLTKCPTCTKPFSETEPRILNEILQKIPKVCKYFENGCTTPAVGDHEIYCQFRNVKCLFHEKSDPRQYCSWEGPARDWDPHVYVTNHCERAYLDVWNGDTGSFLHFKDFVDTKSVLEENLVDEEVFVFTHVKLNGNFCLYVNHFALKKPISIIYFTISFGRSENEVSYKYKIKAKPMLTLEREVNPDENIYCMKVFM